MEEIMAMVIVATIAYAIYKLFELFARRKERMAMIEKISTGIDPQMFAGTMNTFTWKNQSDNAWAVRIGLLLIGVGLGVILATIVDLNIDIATSQYRHRNAMDILYPASAALFGGIGLLIAYFIEKKDNKSDK